MRPAQLWDYFRQTVQAWSEDKAPRMGAALAYYSTFSMAPLLILAIWVAGIAFGEEAARGEIFAQFSATLGPRAASALEEIVQNAHAQTGGFWAGVLGIGLLVFGAGGAFLELQDALNTIWKVEPQKHAGWWRYLRNRFISLSVVVGCGFLLLVSLVFSAALAALHRWASNWHVPGGPIVWQILESVVAVLVITLLFAMMFKLLPDVELRWRDMWVGAFLTAVLFTLGKFAIGMYIAHGSVASSFGAAGTLVAWLVWVYFSSLLVLFGAEFTRIWANRGSQAQQAAPPKNYAKPVHQPQEAVV